MMKKYIQQNKRVVVVLAAVPVIVIMGFLFGLVYTGSTKEIIAVADQFQPDPSWTLESEKITPPRIICIDSVCPQVFRSWSVGTSGVKISELNEMFSGIDVQSNPNLGCRNELRLNDAKELCEFRGQASTFSYVINVLPDYYTNNGTKVTITIE